MSPEPGCIAAIITREIGPPSSIEEATVSNPLQEDDSNQAIDRTAAGSRCGKLLDPCRLLSVRSDTSEEREEQPLPQFRTLATSKKFIPLQQSNMETFSHTFAEL